MTSLFNVFYCRSHLRARDKRRGKGVPPFVILIFYAILNMKPTCKTWNLLFFSSFLGIAQTMQGPYLCINLNGVFKRKNLF